MSLGDVCHHCGKTPGKDASVEMEHPKYFIFILPVCEQSEMFGVEPKKLMPLSVPKSWPKGEDASSLSSSSAEEFKTDNGQAKLG